MAGRSTEGDRDVADQTQPGGGAAPEDDPWAPPERKTSLDKGPRAQTPGSPQPPSVHDQATMTSVPSDGFAPPGAGTPAPGTPGVGTPGPGTPGVGTPGPGTPGVGTPAPGSPGYGYPGPGTPAYGAPGYAPPGAGAAPEGWSESAVPPPPIAPTGPGQHGPGGPGGYGYPAYPQGYGWPGMQAPPQNGLGTSAMILGILSCCLFCLYGIVSLVLGILAVILGVKGKRRADRGEADNRGQAQAGFVTGIVGIVLGLATIALIVFAIVAAVNDERNNTVDDGPAYNSAPSVSAPLLVQD